MAGLGTGPELENLETESAWNRRVLDSELARNWVRWTGLQPCCKILLSKSHFEHLQS